MKKGVLEKCIEMMNSPDEEMMDLGKQIFMESHPTLTDMFVLDMRVRELGSAEEDWNNYEIWSGAIVNPGDAASKIMERARRRYLKDKMLKEIKDEIWSNGGRS